ncbi:MAG: site-specific integrase [Chroococcidiopsidaceae cyanobacterium CP_BM_RX_35]|nr:site-specific integrase [Chroococcidiopsidaceae cyanobacterium CP_BM_RX_35]
MPIRTTEAASLPSATAHFFALLPSKVAAKVSAHWLRHAHASHAMDRGAPVHLVKETLGHANVATTGRYLHARPTDSSSLYLES